MKIQPLQIVVEEDDTGRINLKAVADNRELARAWTQRVPEGDLHLEMVDGRVVARDRVEHAKGRNLHQATIKNHPANSRGDLSQVFDSRESAVAFAKRGLMDIVGNINDEP